MYMDSRLIDIVKSKYIVDDPSHDWLHINRVLSLAKSIALELDANMKILEPAVILHDIVSVPKNNSNRNQASRLAAQKAKTLLEGLDFSNDEIEKISTIILEHSYSANLQATSLESQILQDADKLDAMGAIGVLRWATTGARIKAQYYDESDPWAMNRELDDLKFSLDHFPKKLLKLFERLNTAPAKREGEKRMAFFESYLAQLKEEIK